MGKGEKEEKQKLAYFHTACEDRVTFQVQIYLADPVL